MRKSLTFVLTLVGVALGAALVPPVSAQAAPGLIQQIRDEISDIEAKWVHVDEILMDIDEEISQIRARLMAARDLISAGKSSLGSLVKQYIQAAIQEKEVILTVKFTEFTDFMQSIDEELGALIGKVEAAFEEGKLNVNKKEKIVGLLTGIEQLGEFIGSDATSMTNLLEDGDDGENLDDPQTFDDVDDWLEFCLENQIADGQNDFEQCSESLGQALQLLDEFVSIKGSIYKKKKQAVKRLSTVKTLVRNTGPTRVKKTDAGLSALDEINAVHIYTLSGVLVRAQRVNGPVSLESLKSGLASGVYLAAIGNRVERLVVLR